MIATNDLQVQRENIRPRALAILDPALGKGAHNAAVATQLTSSRRSFASVGVWCNQAISDREHQALSSAGVTVGLTFSVEFFGIFAKKGTAATHWKWISSLASEYAAALRDVLRCWPLGPVLVLHHTLSWEHANALALAIKLIGADGRRLHHIAFLMYSPGIDADGTCWDLPRSLNFRVSFNGLAANPNVSLYSSCVEFGQAYARLLDLPEPVPLHPCFLGDWSRPPERKPLGAQRTSVLYLGQIKADKGFYELPSLLEALLSKSAVKDRFVIQFVDFRPRSSEASEAVVARLVELEQANPQVKVYREFLPDQQLDSILADAETLYLSYEADAYRHKTSGILWLAAWNDLHVVLPAGTWLEREAVRLGMRYSVFLAQPLTTECRESEFNPTAHFHSVFSPFWQWLAAR